MSSPYGSTESASTPLAANGERQVLLTQASVPFSGAAGTTVLPASSAWVASQVQPCSQQRRLCLEFDYAASAGAATGAVEVLVLLCKQKIKVDAFGNVVSVAGGYPGAPLVADDVWFFPSVASATVATGALAAGTLAAGSTFTGGMTFQKVTYGPLVIELGPVTAASAEVRQVVELDATSSFWWYLQAREIGAAANQGILNVSWSLAV